MIEYIAVSLKETEMRVQAFNPVICQTTALPLSSRFSLLNQEYLKNSFSAEKSF